ncbi:CHAT domain-containing protein [Nostoc sp. LPT]|uniref:nSTAND1 domain-containing NTPase n=1 Tax=Nostoc sp. LPT TaxID=2815387 RepID=UPI001DA8995E|nr:CHAT domain-containing protein [Nostoc sp. LPT]MBN4001435.1 CHAT domain-containing protein [Nostoc sp. LPT]
MEVWVNLQFGDGDFEQGFSKIKLQIDAFSTESDIKQLETQLPPAEEIPNSYERWKKIYNLLVQPDSRGFKNNQVTNVSADICSEYAKSLREKLNQWLLPIKLQLEPAITSNTNIDIRLIVNTHGVTSESTKNILHRIPWQECYLFGQHSSSEVALSFKDYLQKTAVSTTKLKSENFRRIKIISIFGDSKDLDTKTDEKLIIQLEKRGAEIISLKEPKRESLQKLWDEPCDILFFAGHSESQEHGKKGIIDLNPNESLDLEEIPQTLKLAISKGLKLAIFNSCDGLGLAQRLADFNLPYVIVWREPVPDKIAHKFLNFFLSSYAGGDSLFTAVLKARGKLQELTGKSEGEKPLPGVSWLPIICKNTLELPPSWSDLGGLSGKLPECPYQGLSAFGEEQADFFFGREKFVDQLVAAVQSKSLVPVVGASGSGKSSVVFAGLVPNLRKIGNVEIISFRPGNNPLGNLAIALNHHCHSPAPLQGENSTDIQRRLDQMVLEIDLRHDETKLCDAIASIFQNLTPLPPFPTREGGISHLVLIADQFEELYTLAPQEERQPFLDALIYAINYAPRFTLVMTLRADFYGYALSYRPFSDALQQGIYNLSPMNREELRCAIEKPAQKMKVVFEEGLTDTLIRDLGNESGRLPLLEFTLMQLWLKPKRWFLTHEAYQEIGGLEKALANYADTVLDKLSEVDRKRAEKIFIQLVCPGEGTEDTRRVATRKQVGEANWDLVQQLADARLLVTGCDETSENKEETVEIIHEALIREWGTFRQWIQDNREFRTWQERLKPNVREWQDHQYDSGRLLQEKPLSVALKWYIERTDELTLQEKEFIQASAEKQNKQEREKKRTNQFTIFGLTAGLVVTSMLASAAWWQWQNSAKSELKAISESSAALFASNQKLDALREAIRARRKLQKLVGVDADTQHQVELVLRRAVYGAVEYNRLSQHSSEVKKVVFSLDGQRIASTSDDKTVKIWKIDGTLLTTLKGHEDTVWDVAFSPDGKTIVSASADKTVKLWKASDSTLLTTLQVSDQVWGVTFSPDGKTIASASNDKTVKLWRASNGTLLTTLKGHQNTVWKVAFSPDGKTIASASADNTVKLWRVSDGTLLTTLQGHQNAVWDVAFSPDAKTIASASGDKTVKLWNKDGTLLTTLNEHQAPVTGVAFSPDGKTIASASWDKTVKLWNKDGTLLTTLNGHSARVWGVTFSPDGKTLASASSDNTVKLWKLNSTLLTTLRGHSATVLRVAYSPNGQMLASTSDDNTVKLWRASDGTLLTILKGQQLPVYAVAFSPDGQIIASGSSDRTIKLWKVSLQEPVLLTTLKGHSNGVWGVAFSPDGKTIASASEDSTVKLWNKDGTLLTTFKGHQARVWGVAFSPDGKTIASASDDNTVKLWNKDGTLLTTFKGHNATVAGVAFSPDGKTIASASWDKTVKLWNKDGTLLTTLKGHKAGVFGVTFSPDGKTIASASDDKTVKLWKVSLREPVLLATLNGHSDRVWGVAFSPDGKKLASASDDKTVILWNLDQVVDVDKVMAHGCDWVRDYLKNNPNVSKSDRTLCNGIDIQK